MASVWPLACELNLSMTAAWPLACELSLSMAAARRPTCELKFSTVSAKRVTSDSLAFLWLGSAARDIAASAGCCSPLPL
eukprot:5576283-Alexandrium_andersonii.AAC.1